MKTCNEFREDWLDETGAPTDDARAHARGCSACHSALTSHAAVWSLLDAAPGVGEAPAAFRAGVWARIDEAERASRRRTSFRVMVPMAGAIAAVCLVWALGPRPGGGSFPDPPAEVLANLDLYENLDYIEEKGPELDRLEVYALGAGDLGSECEDSESWEE